MTDNSLEYMYRLLENIYHPIKHHNPRPGYRHLFNESMLDYPKANRKLIFCRHTETVDILVGDADPGFMHTTYTHTVCKKCGRLIKVDGNKIKGRKFCN